MPLEVRDAKLLAISLFETDWRVEPVVDHLQRALGWQHDWALALATRLGRQLGWEQPPSRASLTAALLSDTRFLASRQALTAASATGSPVRIQSDPIVMRPRAAPFEALDLPSLPTLRSLSVWLGVSVTELDWFSSRTFSTDARNVSAQDRPPALSLSLAVKARRQIPHH